MPVLSSLSGHELNDIAQAAVGPRRSPDREAMLRRRDLRDGPAHTGFPGQAARRQDPGTGRVEIRGCVPPRDRLSKTMFRLFAAVLSLAASAAGGPQGPSSAVPPVTAASINAAAPNGANDKDPSLIAKAETLLDRAHFSPGAIDGLDGDNFRRAVRAFQEVNGLAVTGNLDADTWNKLASSDSVPVLKFYTISEADVAGPFTKVIPAELEAMARLPGLSYTGGLAEIAEKFHMAQSLLQRLNPRADFERAGAEIIVADVPEMKLSPGRHAVEAVPPKDHQGPVAATIVVDKPAGNVRAYDRDGKLLGFYPATMGSEEKPAPSEPHGGRLSEV